MSKESQRGILNEPGFTCPEIDSIIDQLESVRKNIEAIRAWGDGWKSYALQVDDDMEKLADENTDLKVSYQEALYKIDEQQTLIDKLSVKLQEH